MYLCENRIRKEAVVMLQKLYNKIIVKNVSIKFVMYEDFAKRDIKYVFSTFQILEVGNVLYALVIRTENRSISHRVVHVSL